MGSLAAYRAKVTCRASTTDEDLRRLFVLSVVGASDLEVARVFRPPVSTAEWARAKGVAEEFRSAPELWRTVCDLAAPKHASPSGVPEALCDLCRWYDLRSHLWGSMTSVSSHRSWSLLYAMMRQPGALEVWREVVGRTPVALMKKLEEFTRAEEHRTITPEESRFLSALV